MPVTRARTLYFAVPVCLVIGLFCVGSEVRAHGASGAVVAGLIGGFCAMAALIAMVVPRWGPRSEAEKRAVRRAWQHTHPWVVPLGLLGAAVVSGIGAVAGGSVHGLGEFAMTGLGVVFVGAAGIVALMAIKLPQLWE